MSIRVKKTVTPKQLAANRNNSLKSTGPKTPTGKRFASKNALRHGLLCAELVIKTGDGAEDPAEFELMLSQLRAYHHPVGVAEDLLVQRIAACYWRLRRVLRCETGEIRRSQMHAANKEQLRVSSDFVEDIQKQRSAEFKPRLPLNSKGIESVMEALWVAQYEIKQKGDVSPWVR